jgi:hypothetical protein
VLELRHVLFSGAFLREGPGQHELSFEHRLGALDHPVEGRGHPEQNGVPHPALHVLERFAGVRLKPAPVQGLGRDAELDDEVARQVRRLDLAALLLPQAKKGCFVAAHDNSCVGAANEKPAAWDRR